MNALLLLTLAAVAQPAEGPRFVESKEHGRQVVATLPATIAGKLPLGRLNQELGESILSVSIVSADTKKAGPAMLGKYERAENALTFTPRFALIPETTYRATLSLNGKAATVDYRVPALANQTAPKIVKVYPTTDVLPANHLRFYIYFDRPMRGGKELFQLIQLVDDKGNVMDDPWLMDEIWDEENNCLILYIHPGRIKWGVELRQQLGPVLFEKRNYALVIRGELSDLNGNKLGKDHVKKFRTTPEDRVRIDLAQWRLLPALPGTLEALSVTLPKPADHRGLRNCLKVTTDKGEPVTGRIEVGENEKSWRFYPEKHWQRRSYQLHIDPRLEDVAGNTPAEPFDRDLTAKKLPPQRMVLEFESK